MASLSRVPLLAAVALVAITACIGPQAGHRDGYKDEGPPEVVGPRDRVTTHVRGFVTDRNSGVAIAGATVWIDSTSAVTGADGSYTLPNLLLQAGTIRAAKNGYDTSETIIPLAGGEYAFNIRLTANATP